MLALIFAFLISFTQASGFCADHLQAANRNVRDGFWHRRELSAKYLPYSFFRMGNLGAPKVYFLFREITGADFDEVRVVRNGHAFTIFKGELTALPINSLLKRAPERIETLPLHAPRLSPYVVIDELQHIAIGTKQGQLFLRFDQAHDQFYIFMARAGRASLGALQVVRDVQPQDQPRISIVHIRNQSVEPEDHYERFQSLVQLFDVHAVTFDHEISATSGFARVFWASQESEVIDYRRKAQPRDVVLEDGGLLVTSWDEPYLMFERFAPRRHFLHFEPGSRRAQGLEFGLLD